MGVIADKYLTAENIAEFILKSREVVLRWFGWFDEKELKTFMNSLCRNNSEEKNKGENCFRQARQYFRAVLCRVSHN